jgi:hypothetical protein
VQSEIALREVPGNGRNRTRVCHGLSHLVNAWDLARRRLYVSIAVLQNWHGKLSHYGLFWRRAKGSPPTIRVSRAGRVVHPIAGAARMVRCRRGAYPI